MSSPVVKHFNKLQKYKLQNITCCNHNEMPRQKLNLIQWTGCNLSSNFIGTMSLLDLSYILNQLSYMWDVCPVAVYQLTDLKAEMQELESYDTMQVVRGKLDNRRLRRDLDQCRNTVLPFTNTTEPPHGLSQEHTTHYFSMTATGNHQILVIL